MNTMQRMIEDAKRVLVMLEEERQTLAELMKSPSISEEVWMELSGKRCGLSVGIGALKSQIQSWTEQMVRLANLKPHITLDQALEALTNQMIEDGEDVATIEITRYADARWNVVDAHYPDGEKITFVRLPKEGSEIA